LIRRSFHSFPTRRSSDLGAIDGESLLMVRPGALVVAHVVLHHAKIAQLVALTLPVSDFPIQSQSCMVALFGRIHVPDVLVDQPQDRKSTRLNSSHSQISY